MTTIAKYKRRTFKDVAAEAYARGWSEGRAQGLKEAQGEYDALLERHERLRQTAWSRITSLFKGN